MTGAPQASGKKGRRFRLSGGWLAFFLLLATGFAAVYFHRSGLPDFVLRRFRALAREKGFLLDAARVRLDLPRGIVLDDVRLSAGVGEGSIEARAHSVSLRLDWRFLHRRNIQALDQVALSRIRFTMDRRNPVPDPRGSVLLDLAYFQLDRAKTGWFVALAGKQRPGIGIEVRGRLPDPVFGSNGLPAGPADSPRTNWTLPVPARNGIQWFLSEMNQMAFSRPVQVRSVFLLHPTERYRSRLSFTVEGGPVEWRNIRVQSLFVDAGWEPPLWRLERLEGYGPEGRLSAEGQWDVERDLFSGQIAGEGAWKIWRRLLPARLSGALDEIPVGADGTLAFQWAFDSISRSELLCRGSGWIRAENLSLDGTRVDDAYAEVVWDRPLLRLRNAEVLLGRGKVQGNIAMDFQRRYLDARFSGTVDPDALLPWVLSWQARYMGAAVLLSDLPNVEGEISGSWAQRHALCLRCHAIAKDVVYHGSYLARIESDIQLDGPILSFTNLRVVRPEGELTGWVRRNRAESVTSFDIDSRVDPQAIARMIGPASHRFLQRFRIEGPVHVLGQGSVDTGKGEKTRVQAHVEGEKLGLAWFLADRATFDFSMEGPDIHVDEFQAGYGDGALQGSASFSLPVGGEGSTRYALELQAKDVGLSTLAADLTWENTSPYTGRVNGQLSLEGPLEKKRRKELTGAGWVQVQGDGLLRIPVLFGLSDILSNVYPGLGFFSQDKLYADITVSDGRVHSDEVRLDGDLISMKGRGGISFNRQLNGRVQVQLLRQGMTAQVLRFLTAPLSKLLEFDLRGTVSNPQWRPRNFSLQTLTVPFSESGSWRYLPSPLRKNQYQS